MGFYNVINAPSMAVGQPEDISQVLANFNAIAAVLNGNLDNTNIVAGAGITRSKLDFGAGLVNSDISLVAGIMGSKLNWSVGANPPGAPNTGDIWVYNGISGVFWVFMYDSTEATWKWKYIGGAPYHVHGTPTANLTGNTVWTAIGPTASFLRYGIYDTWMDVDGQLGGASTVDCGVVNGQGSVVDAISTNYGVRDTQQGGSWLASAFQRARSQSGAAGGPWSYTPYAWNNSGGAWTLQHYRMEIRPVQVI